LLACPFATTFIEKFFTIFFTLKRLALRINTIMKRLYLILGFLVVLILGTSNIFLWYDNNQQWKILNTQIQMLNRLITLYDDRPLQYEDEIPRNTTTLGEEI
jgi:hypothetical protein